MIIKKYLGKKINIGQLESDIADRTLTGVWYYKKGKSDKNFDVVEIPINRNTDYIYAVKIFLTQDNIEKIIRVKFQTMCGGWQSKDYLLKRFPVHMLGGEWAEEFIKEYLV